MIDRRKITACSDCKRPIIFGRTVNGRAMPLDVEAYSTPGERRWRLRIYPDGNVHVDQFIDGVPQIVVLKKAELAQPRLDEAPRHKAHMATCPKRKAKR